ncbi:MAG: phospho-N-acetylmuramoyl-pentapeptide-transferase [Bdellovibrionales bacterium]|nr:phospho-N-acetylmuramoyl-pentapeptide-transferase [Bdellovibrionales bacterium]
MLYKWLFTFSDQFQIFNLFQYITFRSFLAFFTSFFVCLLLGHFFIKKLTDFGEKINTDSPNSHQKKRGTPTMGGGFMLLSLFTVCLLWIDLSQSLVLASLFTIYSFAFVGLWDDLLKFKHSNFKGIKVRWRLLIEFTLSSLVLSYLNYKGYISTELYVPFFKNVSFDLGGSYILFGAFVITGCANAVNLTDGLDGLAIFPVMICSLTLFILSYLAGHSKIANYLNIPFILGAGELSPLLAGVIACCLGFLWFNSYPAQVFMGDVGSLGLGSFLGITAVLTKNEFLLILFGGIFVVEALSVIFQVFSYKLLGKRIFKMAPLHHHFELKGLEESKIIVRFWIVSILLAVLSLAALKIR